MLHITLAKYNTNGNYSEVKNDDGETIRIVENGAGGEAMAAEVCLSTARALREAATRFELLAKEREPYKLATHNKINRWNIRLEPPPVDGLKPIED